MPVARTQIPQETRSNTQTEDTGYQERNLCVAYADHDVCPYREIDEHGTLVFCSCSCHLDPEALP